jgi:hypothetical protein
VVDADPGATWNELAQGSGAACGTSALDRAMNRPEIHTQ